MNFSKIIGTGSYVPQELLTNEMLEKMVDTTDEWIMQRVGVKTRHIIGKSKDNTTTMALVAAKNALKMAGISADEVDMIVVGTATPQFYFPSTACLVQQQLNIKKDIPAFDVNAACAGFIYGLSIADQYIKSAAIKTALVIGSESLTRTVDFTDRGTCILFGDGAGAVVIRADKKPGILSTHIHANGHYSHLITANNPIWQEKDFSLKMAGAEVFKVAVTKLGEIVDQTIEKSGLQKSDIDWLVPHQANFRIIQATAKRLNMPLSRVVLTVEQHGNTSAASIPLALDTAVRSGQIKAGETLLLEAFGAGLAWGSALVKY